MSWTWALLIPCVFNIVWGITVIFILPESPEHVGIDLSECSNSPRQINERKLEEGEFPEYIPISWSEALQIPNVIGYSLAFGFFKFNNYALFFNLPFWLSQNFTSQDANLISILYDVGMMPGGVFVGNFLTYNYTYIYFYALINIFAHLQMHTYIYD
jgi:sugar phosphate permease